MRTPRVEIDNSLASPATNNNNQSSTSRHLPQQQPQRSSSSSARTRLQQQQSQREPRYHFNHLEAPGMPLNIWGIDRRDVWRTCFCFHVRTVTIFIGVLHLMYYILWLSFIAAMFMYDPAQDGPHAPHGGKISGRQEQNMLPTPVSVSKLSDGTFEMKSDSLTIDQSDNPRARLDPLNMVMDTRKANSQMVLLTVCNILITLLMVYGSVRGKPSYLMPFFVLRVFDFCIFCLTMVGYFSYLPNVTDSISNNHWVPYREYLLEMDPQVLSLLMLVTIVILIAMKAYMIGVIWNCYKYLMLRNSVIRTVIAYRHDDPANLMGLQQNLLPDLPDYETAVNDPRYAKKPPMDPNANGSSATNINGNSGSGGLGAGGMLPPPPYSVAIATEPLTYNFQLTPEEEQQIQQQQSESVVVESHQVEQEHAQESSSAEVETPTTNHESAVPSSSSTQPQQSSSSSHIATAPIVIEVAPAPAVAPSTPPPVVAADDHHQ